MMTTRNFIALCFIVVSLNAGCAMFDERDKTLRDMNSRITDLDTQLAASNARIDELDNKFHLLQEKLQTVQSSRQVSVQQASDTAQPGLNPPDGLKVIQLRADGKQTAVIVAPSESASPKPQPDNVDVASETDNPSGPAQSVADATPDGLYAQGQDLFIAGRYAQARRVFSKLAETYPKHGLADNALYWLGESYYTEKTFQKALSVFLDITDRYPKENKAPEAMLKAGYSYMELGSEDKAEETFTLLLKRYPDSEAAVKAKIGLARLVAGKQK